MIIGCEMICKQNTCFAQHAFLNQTTRLTFDDIGCRLDIIAINLTFVDDLSGPMIDAVDAVDT